MTVDKRSRYYGLPVYSNGGRLTLSQRLLVRQQDTGNVLLHRLTDTETLDQLALRYYGRDDLWWRIADANPGRFLLDWQAGDVVKIPLDPNAPQTGGR